jgi:hypothetical protein
MKFEDQVCSLELAKLLKRLSVPQNSLCYWNPVPHPLSSRRHPLPPKSYRLKPFLEQQPKDQFGDELFDAYSAFTAAELGEMLPVTIDVGKKGYGISSELLAITKGTFSGGTKMWQVMYYDVISFNDKTEAGARAKMLIHLLQENLLVLDTTSNTSGTPATPVPKGI